MMCRAAAALTQHCPPQSSSAALHCGLTSGTAPQLPQFRRAAMLCRGAVAPTQRHPPQNSSAALHCGLASGAAPQPRWMAPPL